jgi:hypothetical protein
VINPKTVNALGLKPVTRTMCHDFYVKINTECDSSDAIKESVSWWQQDKGKLNYLWWVLNYYSDRLDPDRNLRAFVEKHLDALVPPEPKESEETIDAVSDAP